MTPDDPFHLVAWALLRRGEDLLVARRAGVSYGAGLWGPPGGHVEPGEALAAAAARETREEVGVDVDPADLAPVGMSRYVDHGVQGLDVFLAAGRFAGEPGPVSECDAVAWAPVAALVGAGEDPRLPGPLLPWLPGVLRRHLVEGEWFVESLT